MRTEIFLENEPLDIYDDLDTAFTFAIDDVKDFGSKNTNFSKTIVIPGNAVNNKAFGHVFAVGSSNFYDPLLDNYGYNFNPMVSARCTIFVDRIQVFKGSLRVLAIVNTDGTIEYECFVFGELGGFMFEIANRRLQDLDFSAYDMPYTVANIQASWDSIAGSGVYFPLIDYGNVSTDKHNFQYTAFRPALFVKEYIEKIFAATSYTLTMPELDTALFNRLVIAHNGYSLTKTVTQMLTLSNNTPYPVLDAGGSFNYIGWTNFTGADFTQGNVNQKYTYTPAVGATMVTNVVMSGLLFAPGKSFTVSIYKNGAYLAGSQQVFASGASDTPWYYSYSGNISLFQNDYIEVGVLATGTLGSIEFFQLYAANFQGDNTTPQTVPLELGDDLTINNLIPRGIFQKDFFISILKMINGYVYESVFDEKVLLVKPYVDFYPTTAEDALNWTNKIDRSQPIRIVPMSELNARYYQYKFKDDNDFYNEDYRKAYNQNYGDRLFDTTYEFSKDTSTLDVIFANSVLYKNSGEDKTFQAIYKLSGSTETSMDHVLRISQAKKITGVTSYNILNGATVLASPTAYGYAGHLDDPSSPTNDICFGAPAELYFDFGGVYPTTNLFNAYHSEYLAEITDKDSKLVIAQARLTPLDIQTLDFSKFIYVDGVLFRLNKITDYMPVNEGMCEIQLLKVIDY